MLEIKNVSKTFAKDTVNEHKALNNINLTLNDGEFVTIVGSNGAGKSTLFNMICGTARIFPLCLSTKEQGSSEGFSKTL